MSWVTIIWSKREDNVGLSQLKGEQKTMSLSPRFAVLFAGFIMLAASSTMAQTAPPEGQSAALNSYTATKAIKPAETRENSEIDLLKAQLAAQQDELTALRKAVEEQGKLIARVLQTNANSATPAAISSLTSASDANELAGRAAPATSAAPAGDASLRSSQAIAEQEKPSPLSFRIGTAQVTPLGFIDFTAVIRDKNVGSGIGTNFGAIPFNNTVNGHLSEFRLSAQNSRFGLRVDAKVRGMNLLGYLETDFLGLAPGNVAVTSNSDTQRLRLVWADLRRKKLEVLAGQSWSMLTPNRTGLSPLPADIFFGQGLDTNYLLGLTWSRNPQFRLIYHASDTVTLGWSIEASEQYGGGSGGSGVITLPSALAAAYEPQLNTGNNTFAVPNAHQDNIVKIAFDPKSSRAMHFEVAGLLSQFSFYNPLSNKHFGATGGGAAINGNIELVKNFRLIANTFVSSGGGRWIFGQGPDLIIRGDGSPALVRSASTVDGFEYQATPKTLFYAYYGGAYFQKNVVIDPANGQQIGFGYTGSPSNHNRAIQEGTFGFTQTLWRDPNYGAIQFMTQYSYLVRHPWYVAPGQPGTAKLKMLFLNLRYTLPGAPPATKH
jgi:hypothetical protein